jgi:hypothetical protein
MSNYTKTTNFATKDNLSPGNPLKIVKGTEIDTEYNNIATAVATKTDNSAAAITGGTITGITDLAVADGGTGASTAAGALNNLLPSQTSAANKYLQSDGTNASWDAVSLSTADITGTLAVANGGTGVTTSTGTTNVVLSNSPTLVTPALGTPSAAVLTNATGLPISTGVSGLGTGVATLLATPSSANLASAITDETGSGALVFATSPTLVTPILGTPTSGTLTNATGLPIGTGVSGLGTGVATFLATPSSANLAAALTDETGSGAAVFATSPTLVTPILGTPTSATLTNATGLPLTTGVTGLLPVANGGTATATPSIVAGSNITVTGTWPNQTIAASGGGSPGGSTTQVQYNNAGSFGGITGATTNGTALTLVAPVLGTPASATLTNATGLPLSSGVTGTLPVANGGTGQTTYTDGQLLIGNTNGNTLTKATLTAGTGVTITNGSGAITIAATASAATATTVSDTANTSTGYFQIPQGTTAQRPGTPANGMIRLNTSTNVFEIYSTNLAAWTTVTSLTTAPSAVEYLVVAGGGSGAGGGGKGGGGGAGGFRTASGFAVTSGTPLTVTVGAGGASAATTTAGVNGSNSVFSSITSTGGGGGGGAASTGNVNGSSGGSGGGGGAYAGAAGTGGAATSGQGNVGGAATPSPEVTGGGGGAGAVGVAGNSSTQKAGDGGAGTASSISGSSVTYGGGGGGAADGSTPVQGSGGAGGGGTGMKYNGGVVVAVGSGTVNTGGGGGGSISTSGLGSGAGGSGIVIIRYADSFSAAVSTTGSPTITVVGGYRVYQFTASGSITF